MDAPLAQPTFVRRPLSLCQARQSSTEDFSGTGSVLVSDFSYSVLPDSGLTLPTAEPPMVCAQARAKFKSPRTAGPVGGASFWMILVVARIYIAIFAIPRIGMPWFLSRWLTLARPL